MILAPLLLALISRPDEALAQTFLASLNGKDRPTVVTFVRDHFDPRISPEEFSVGLMRIADYGAPFKMLKVVDDSPQLFRALIENSHSERVALSVMFDGKTPPRITGVFFGDPESLEAPPPKDYSGWTDLSHLASDLREATQCPAVAVGYMLKDSTIQVAVDGVRSIGKSDRVTPNDVWHLGSVSKSITSTLIGKLIELGKLDWDTPLSKLLPGVKLRPDQGWITVHQIMLHRSGLPRDMTFTGADVERIVGSEKDPVKVRERYMADILARPLINTPGTQFAYSNAGYVILGHLAERIMGKPFEQLCRDLVFQPMGLKSAVAGTAGLPAKRPSGHRLENGTYTPVTVDGRLQMMMTPAGNMSMSLPDLLRYGHAHMVGLLGKDGILKASTIKRLHEALPEEEDGDGYACGWSIGPLRGTQLRHGHNGSNGTFVAELAFFPEAGLVAASIVNKGGGGDPSPSLQAVRAIAKRFAPAPR